MLAYKELLCVFQYNKQGGNCVLLYQKVLSGIKHLQKDLGKCRVFKQRCLF